MCVWLRFLLLAFLAPPPQEALSMPGLTVVRGTTGAAFPTLVTAAALPGNC